MCRRKPPSGEAIGGRPTHAPSPVAFHAKRLIISSDEEQGFADTKSVSSSHGLAIQICGCWAGRQLLDRLRRFGAPFVPLEVSVPLFRG